MCCVGSVDPLYISYLRLCYNKSQLPSVTWVDIVIWASVLFTKSWIVKVRWGGYSHWEKTSWEAILEGNDGDESCSMVNYGQGADVAIAEIEGKNCWASMARIDTSKVCNL